MEKPNTYILEFDLLENAIDSLEHGIEHLYSENRELFDKKYAILHISHSVELFLKEKLSTVAPDELFIDKKRAKTVTWLKAFDLLEEILEDDFFEFRKDLEVVFSIRNHIQHYKFNNDSLEVMFDSCLIKSLKFIEWFCEEHLSMTLRDNIDSETYEKLSSYSHDAEKRMEKVTDDWLDYIYENMSPKEASYSSYDDVECPECGKNTGLFPSKYGESIAFCADPDCHTKFEVQCCSSCGLMKPVYEEYACGDCISYQLNSE
ncbi:MAG: hypothetical protein KDK51_07540 [Deltaproteobacteria bacterium]|nr:hypothetical protein [Deltaproteobacteria bacterium]